MDDFLPTFGWAVLFSGAAIIIVWALFKDSLPKINFSRLKGVIPKFGKKHEAHGDHHDDHGHGHGGGWFNLGAWTKGIWQLFALLATLFIVAGACWWMWDEGGAGRLITGSWNRYVRGQQPPSASFLRAEQPRSTPTETSTLDNGPVLCPTLHAGENLSCTYGSEGAVIHIAARDADIRFVNRRVIFGPEGHSDLFITTETQPEVQYQPDGRYERIIRVRLQLRSGQDGPKEVEYYAH